MDAIDYAIMLDNCYSDWFWKPNTEDDEWSPLRTGYQPDYLSFSLNVIGLNSVRAEMDSEYRRICKRTSLDSTFQLFLTIKMMTTEKKDSGIFIFYRQSEKTEWSPLSHTVNFTVVGWLTERLNCVYLFENKTVIMCKHWFAGVLSVCCRWCHARTRSAFHLTQITWLRVR